MGLVLNELVTNAFKYAYPEGGGGPVVVRLTPVRDSGLRLEVADQGVGLPDGFDITARRNSLGSRLIVNTVRQLQGSLEASANQPRGARFTITMPVRPA